jgi:DNA-binding transcriptional LysR family regulator
MSFRFDLTDLRLFLCIVEGGSITAGARVAHLSLAAASARVLGMEQELASPLLHRGHRGVTVTAAGLTLAQHARVVLGQAERLRLNLEELARNVKSHIALIGTSAAIREYLPDTLGAFLASHPQVNVSVTEAAGEEAVQAILAGQSDIAFVTDRTSVKGLDSVPFVMNRFALVVPAGHPLVNEARGRPISIVHGDGYDVVGLNEGSALQDSWERRAAARGVRLRYRVRVPSFDAQLRLIEHGVGLAMLPEATARRAARIMAIEVLPLSDPYLVRRLLVCTRRFSELSPDARRLVQMLLEAHMPESDPASAMRETRPVP